MRLAEFVPQLLKANCSMVLSVSAQQSDHLAERPHPPVFAVAGFSQQASDQIFKAFRVGRTIHYQLRKRFRRIQRNE